VAIFIGSLLVSGLLAIVVELLKVNSREETLSQAQQSMQRAMDYMTSDLSEAVFVYSEPTTLAAVTNQLTDLPTGAKPVLGFWRLDPVSNFPACTGFTGAKKRECDTLQVRQNVYTLVVYLHQTNTAADIWSGPARIIRYELSRYSNVTTLTERTGYADPTIDRDTNGDGTPDAPNSFQDWVRQGTTTAGVAQTLTDYVANAGTSGAACPDLTPADTSDGPNYNKVGTPDGSFYACVATGDQTQNKSVILYLQGDATENPQAIRGPVSQSSKTPALESEVLIRGAIESLP
jgi:type II secretory pathway component PulJ